MVSNARIRDVGMRTAHAVRSNQSTFVMAVIIILLAFWLIVPALLIVVQTFNVAANMFVDAPQWGLDNWRVAFAKPGFFQAIYNTVLLWVLTLSISFPIGVVIAWTLARTRVPGSHAIEFLFWIAYMIPGISTTIAWMTILDPDVGMVNRLLSALPFVDDGPGPFNIYSVQGIVWAKLMGDSIAVKVMFMTPVFRNMDASLEEAARVGGASTLRTMIRITLPLMSSIMVLVIALQLVRIFQGFETEQLLGVPFGFFVYSTLIFHLIRVDGLPDYGTATALASITMLAVVVIIPIQRWMLHRRIYTTVGAGFRPFLIDIGPWRWIAFGLIAALLLALTIGPMLVLVLGSFMTKSGYFSLTPLFTMDHWATALTSSGLLKGLRTTLMLATFAAVMSPLLFSILAYIIVRTTWRGRALLDTVIWGSAVIPGLLSGLGLLIMVLQVPGLKLLYGTFTILLIVVLMQGNTTGINLAKGAIVQIGRDMEDAGRVAGAGWLKTYFRIWLPIMSPMLTLLAVLNFVTAAGATSSIILLASRDTFTLSILALEISASSAHSMEDAITVSLILMFVTVGAALVAKLLGVRVGVRQR